MSAAAAYWHADVRFSSDRIHVLGIAGLSAGVLVACTFSLWDTGDWLAYHILLMTWCVVGLSAAVAASARCSSPFPGRSASLLPPRELRHWIEGIGLGILALVAPNCWTDPQLPIAPAAAVLAVSGMAGMLALWMRRTPYVWISGLLLDLIAILFWSAWGIDLNTNIFSFVFTNVIGLAAAGGRGLASELSQESEETPALIRLPYSSFSAFAINTALGLVALFVVLLIGMDLHRPPIPFPPYLAWSALAAVGLALVVALWDRRSTFAPGCLYILGLSAIGLALHQLTGSLAGLGWSAALALAVFILIASLIFRISPRFLGYWFLPAQTLVAGLVVALSLWMCLDFEMRVDRLAGPAAVLLLIPASLLLMRSENRRKTGSNL